MSGIFGLYYPDGRPVNRSDVERMGATLAHRGPDRTGVGLAGPVGLGHCLLHTTPESLLERMPLVSQAAGLVLTADARIDNWADLTAALGLDDCPPGELTDSALILAAYEKWGERCPEKLVGDFAFAIWDERQQKLFCARDHFGIRPLYYYHSPRLFAFASEIKALLCLPEVPRQLNELRVGYHLAALVEDKAITFYQDVARLLPGHSLTVSRAGVHLRTFWALDPEREVHLASDEAYAEAFRELFIEAVRCRLRASFPIGSLLSGGLDSSAVTCTARSLLVQDGRGPLPTISATFAETPECDERAYIEVVLKQGNLSPHYVAMDRVNPWADLEKMFTSFDEPFTAPTAYILWNLNQAAQGQGIRVLLDGIDGDTAVYHGDGYLAELARRSQWATFTAEARAIAGHENLPSVPYLFEQYGRPYLTELALNRHWLAFGREIQQLSRHIALSRRRAWWHWGLQPALVQPVRQAWSGTRSLQNGHSGGIISRELAARTALDERLESFHGSRRPPRTAREEHYSLLTSGLVAYIFELSDRVNSAFSLEGRHPFADRRLVEFCLALPPGQKLQQGWIRSILRRALAGILPEEIRWRGGKTVNSPAVTAALLNGSGRLLEEIIMHRSGNLAALVDMKSLQEIYQRYLSHRSQADEMAVWQAANLGLWLRYSGLVV